MNESTPVQADEYDQAKIAALAPFDVADHLGSEEMIAAYLNEFEGETDPDVLGEAHDAVRRARLRLGGGQP